MSDGIPVETGMKAGGPRAAPGAIVFERLKDLVGKWRGQRPGGGEIGVDYRLSAGGTVLVETWTLGPGWESLTIYHLDESHLMASHFCPQGNQPRLKMRRASEGRIDFTFHDATGVEPGQAVQHEFWIEIRDEDAFTRGETYVEGDEHETETVTYQRVKE